MRLGGKEGGCILSCADSCGGGVVHPPLHLGSSTFFNVDGYLEAALVPERTFYGVMGIFYLVIGLIWVGLLAVYYKVGSAGVALRCAFATIQ